MYKKPKFKFFYFLRVCRYLVLYSPIILDLDVASTTGWGLFVCLFACQRCPGGRGRAIFCYKRDLHMFLNQARVKTFLSYFENNHFIVTFLDGYCTHHDIARSSLRILHVPTDSGISNVYIDI